MKIGDKILCIKSIRGWGVEYNERQWYKIGILETAEPHIFVTNLDFLYSDSKLPGIWFSNNEEAGPCFSDYFLTIPELRKLKLKKIGKI